MSKLFTNWNAKKIILLALALVAARFLERKVRGADEVAQKWREF